jgi:hypothetical protein
VSRYDFNTELSEELERLVAQTRVLNEEEFDKLPQITWLIRKTIPIAALSVVFGEPKCGKSHIELDQGLHVAAQKPDWCGRKIIELKDGEGVVYVAAEGARGMRRRKKAWMKYHGVTSIPKFFVVDHKIDMRDADNVLALAVKIHRLGIKPRWIIIDTLARCFGDGNENTQQDMNAFVDSCDSLFQTFFEDCAVTVVHHSGKDKTKGARGSNVLFGALDAEFCVEKRADRTIILKNTGMKDTTPQPDLAFTLVTVDGVEIGDEDDPDPPVVLQRVEVPLKEENAAEGPEKKPLTRHHKAYDILRRMGTEWHSSAAWLAKCLETGISERSFGNYKKKLVDELHWVEKRGRGKEVEFRYADRIPPDLDRPVGYDRPVAGASPMLH